MADDRNPIQEAIYQAFKWTYQNPHMPLGPTIEEDKFKCQLWEPLLKPLDLKLIPCVAIEDIEKENTAKIFDNLRSTAPKAKAHGR